MINIVINSDPKYSVNKLAIQGAVLEILQENQIRGNVEIGVSIVGDKKIHEFNKQYRNLDKPTNILTFALQDPVGESDLQFMSQLGGFVNPGDQKIYLGDIFISQPTALKEARMEGISLDEYFRFLVQHGTRHLLGIHHE